MALTNMDSDLIFVAPSGLPINYSEEFLFLAFLGVNSIR